MIELTHRIACETQTDYTRKKCVLCFNFGAWKQRFCCCHCSVMKARALFIKIYSSTFSVSFSHFPSHAQCSYTCEAIPLGRTCWDESCGLIVSRENGPSWIRALSPNIHLWSTTNDGQGEGIVVDQHFVIFFVHYECSKYTNILWPKKRFSFDVMTMSFNQKFSFI